jgi:outer membrane receptor protein involved in Fe transport
LKPELSWGLDAGYEHYPAGGGKHRTLDLLPPDHRHRAAPDQLRRRLYISRPENLGTGTVRGVEFDAKGKLTQLWDGAPGIRPCAPTSPSTSPRSTPARPYNRIDEQPPWNGTAGADYRFTSLPLTLGTSFTARGAGTVRTSPQQVIYRSINRQWEAFALWRFSPKVQLRLSVQDLLAQDNIQVNRFTDATAS